MIKLGIRVANSITSGRGHFERCLSISRHMPAKIFWLLDEKNKFSESKINKKDEIIYEKDNSLLSLTYKAISEKKINIILIDSYNINLDDVSNLSKKIPVCIFQDTNKLADAQMIICPQPIKIKNYFNVVSLCGPKFAPISNELIVNNDDNDDNNDTMNILISMGSYDSLGITLNIIKAVQNLSFKLKKIMKTTIVLGTGSPIIKEVEKIIKEDLDFNLLIDVKNMNNIYNNSNIAIGAPGLSHMERLYIGLPTILIAQNVVHETLIDKWVNLGCAIKSSNNIKVIEKKILNIIENKIISKELIKNGKKLIDGKGAFRIAQAILKVFKTYD
jgi:spore coat polysaccharide biosynthesis predicted glycosyltransferase SpsG